MLSKLSTTEGTTMAKRTAKKDKRVFVCVCPKCKGTGRVGIDRKTCSVCSGYGFLTEEKH
jgi:DnaJ-class molecular chaperone